MNDAGAPFLKTGKVYVAGDFRGDVAGAAGGLTVGAHPRGWDSVVDEKDIDYCCRMAQIGDWSNIDDAVYIDLSCDMDGDLDVDADDVTELVEVILGTTGGDVDLDGDVDDDDFAIVEATILAGAGGCNGDASCGWADGDTNCDSIVDETDLDVFESRFDVNDDGDVDLFDYARFHDCLTGPEQPMNAGCEPLDFDQDVDVDMADFWLMQPAFRAP